MSATRAPRVGTLGYLLPTGLFDLADKRVSAHTGHHVEVVQPHGCPRNGTMGHMYVDCLDCGAEPQLRYFVGLVLISSFVKEG